MEESDDEGYLVPASPTVRRFLRQLRNQELEPLRLLRRGESLAATRWRRRRR